MKNAEHGESCADFVHKMAIALKEVNETLKQLIIYNERVF
ncbi:MAG: four helix bundle protein [Okeania sp. SIO3I5]|nr:four helix bundle protein [Okeania sp. SIO3I5]NEQ39707.1 four helix bundle protein [Okeania sp. SIO3I5]